MWIFKFIQVFIMEIFSFVTVIFHCCWKWCFSSNMIFTKPHISGFYFDKKMSIIHVRQQFYLVTNCTTLQLILETMLVLLLGILMVN